MASPLLEVSRLTKQIGGLTAVHEVDLTVGEGEIVGLVGPNGAGKTTFMNMISGISRPTSGRVHFSGEDITGLAPERICKKGIARPSRSRTPFPISPPGKR